MILLLIYGFLKVFQIWSLFSVRCGSSFFCPFYFVLVILLGFCVKLKSLHNIWMRDISFFLDLIWVWISNYLSFIPSDKFLYCILLNAIICSYSSCFKLMNKLSLQVLRGYISYPVGGSLHKCRSLCIYHKMDF